MNREQATNLIKEIDEECRDIRGTSIMLMAPKESSIDSEGYQVHIRLKMDQKKLRCLETIAEQYGYAVKNEPDKTLVVIYTPTAQETAAKPQSSLPTGRM